MRRGFVFGLSLMIVVFFVSHGFGAPSDKPIVLKFADIYPLEHVLSKMVNQAWNKKVEERTGGRIKIQLYPAEQLGKAREFPELLSRGVADLAFLVPHYYAGTYKLNMYRILPCLYSKASAMKTIELNLQVEALPEIQEEFKKFNMVPMLQYAMDPPHIELNRGELTSLEAMKAAKLKIRAAGGLQAGMLQAWGYTVVTMPSPEVYMALQSKVIDGAIMHLTSFKDWKWYEVCKYVVVLNRKEFPGGLSRPAGWVAMNLNTWNNLPKDLQRIMLEVSQEQAQESAKAMEELANESETYVKSKGVQFIELSRDDSLKMVDMIKPLWEEWAKVNGEPGRKIINKVTEISRKMGIYPFR